MWHSNVDVQYVYATHGSQQAWAVVSGVSGWQPVATGSPNGVANITRLLSAANAHGRKVNVYIDGGKIERAVLR